MKQYKTVNNLIGWITFIIAATVYCMTIEPTASFWDCPEFITTGYKLEVGHPPGAPFFMLVANLFSQFASDASTDEARGISGTVSVTDEDGTVYYVPNDMVTANAFFTENENGGTGNEYINSIIAKVGEDGELTIGLKKTGTNYGSDWVICDNWTLTYYGKDSKKTPTTGITNAVSDRKFTVKEVYTLDGRRVKRLQKGLNIVKVEDANGNVSFKKMIVR